MRSRRCIRFPREELCWGDTHEYRLCQQPDCPPGAMPFRDLQCALYNGHPVLGTQKTYQWVPFYGAPNHCDLNCLAVGHDFYHSFGRVLDGTPCSPGAQDLCVAGRCLVRIPGPAPPPKLHPASSLHTSPPNPIYLVPGPALFPRPRPLSSPRPPLSHLSLDSIPSLLPRGPAPKVASF